MEAKFSPSLMCMDFLNAGKQISILNKRMDFYHVDIMDGHFCKNITLSPDLLKSFSAVASLPIDVHLMTETPRDWIESVAESGAAFISLHAETINSDAFRLIHLIKNLGCKVGIVLNPATSLNYIREYIHYVDLLTIMTVDVGFAGQPFIEEMLEKIREAQKIKLENGYKYMIQIDGSCNEKTFKRLQNAGAEVFVVGSSGLFSKSDDLNQACDIMYGNYQNALR